MDYQIASKKLIFTTVISSIIFITASFIFSLILSRKSIALCSNGQSIVGVIHLEHNQTILIPSKSLKDTLSCVGKGMSLYDRTIELIYAHGMSTSFLEELNTRYTVTSSTDVINIDLQPQINTLKDTIRIDADKQYVIFRTHVQNPFEFEEVLDSFQPQIVVVPELDFVIKQLLEKSEKMSGIQLIELREGETATYSL